MNRLLAIGFIPVGSWELNENQDMRYNLNSNQNTRNILYAFISNGNIKYVGKTTQRLTVGCMAGNAMKLIRNLETKVVS